MHEESALCCFPQQHQQVYSTTHGRINSLSTHLSNILPEMMTSTYCISVLGKDTLLKAAFTADALDSANLSQQENRFLPFPFRCHLMEMPSAPQIQWSWSTTWIPVLEPAASATERSRSPCPSLEFKNAKHIVANRSRLLTPGHAWLSDVNSRFLGFFIKEFFFLLSQLYSVSEFFFFFFLAWGLCLIICNLLFEDRCPGLIKTSNFENKLGLNFPWQPFFKHVGKALA